MDKFYLGMGGLGDFLIFISTFYDCLDEKINVIWFTENGEQDSIKELSSCFEKIKNILVFSKSISINKWFDFVSSNKCLGTGITPKNLNYSEWKDVDIFKKYNVIEFPKFVEEFNQKTSENYICVMASGGRESEKNVGKNKSFSSETVLKIVEETKNKKVYLVGKDDDIRFPKEWNRDFLKKKIKDQMFLIKNAQKVYSVDSWVKTWSAMCGIETIVFDSIYSSEYLNRMGGTDWGHYVFIFPWSKISLMTQIKK
jgi:hypothetical protein